MPSLDALNLSAARGIAVQEIHSQGGPTDYILFFDGKALGIVEAKRRKTDVTIDHLTGDTVISAGYDEEKARQLVTSWKQFLEDNQDEITALQIIYNKPHARERVAVGEVRSRK